MAGMGEAYTGIRRQTVFTAQHCWTQVVPFLPEDRLKERGGIYSKVGSVPQCCDLIIIALIGRMLMHVGNRGVARAAYFRGRNLCM